VSEVVGAVTYSTPVETKLGRFHIWWLGHTKGQPTQFRNSLSPDNMGIFEGAAQVLVVCLRVVFCHTHANTIAVLAELKVRPVIIIAFVEDESLCYWVDSCFVAYLEAYSDVPNLVF
jgi:hypothetical protein